MNTEIREKILFVDDDINVLQGIQRQLHKYFNLFTAENGEKGLEAIVKNGPFAVIVADMRMPIMDGIQFLSRAKKISPDSVRVMLTGNADLETAMNAVNEGNIFRFLTKPCTMDMVGKALLSSIEQHRLITAERELLEKTLKGSMEVIADVLSLIDSDSFGQIMRLKEYLKRVDAFEKIENLWALELAAMFLRLGLVTVPVELREKARRAETLSAEEVEILARVPEIGQRLLAHIPRIETVTKIMLYQNKLFNGAGYPLDTVAGANIPWGSRLLKILSDLESLEIAGLNKKDALEQMNSRKGWYDLKLLNTVSSVLLPLSVEVPQVISAITISFAELQVNDLLISNIETQDNRLLVASGTRISQAIIERLRSYARLVGIKEPIKVERIQVKTDPI